MSPAEIKKRREAAGLRQVDLAEQLDVHKMTIANWEAGRSKPHPLRLPLLEALLKSRS